MAKNLLIASHAAARCYAVRDRVINMRGRKKRTSPFSYIIARFRTGRAMAISRLMNDLNLQCPVAVPVSVLAWLPVVTRITRLAFPGSVGRVAANMARILHPQRLHFTSRRCSLISRLPMGVRGILLVMCFRWLVVPVQVTSGLARIRRRFWLWQSMELGLSHRRLFRCPAPIKQILPRRTQ